MSQDPVNVELVRRVTNLEDDLMRQTARISVPVSSAFFSAYATTTTALGAGVATTVALAGIVYTDGNFTSSTYVCPVDGNYLFAGAVNVTPPSSAKIASYIAQNGTAVFQGATITTAAAAILPVAGLLLCRAGDDITLLAYCSVAGGSVGSGGQHTYFAGQIQ